MKDMGYNRYDAPAKGSVMGLESGAVAPRARRAVTELGRARDDYAHGDIEGAAARLDRLLVSNDNAPAQSPELLDDDRTTACAWSLYGRVLSSLGQETNATTAFQIAVQLFDRFVTPDSAESGQLRSDYGRALFRTGDSARAIVELKRALEHNYLTHDTLKYLGLALAMQSPEESVHYLEQALSLRPDDGETQMALAVLRRRPEGFIQLGHYLRLNGNPDGALNAFNNAVDLAVDDEDRRAEARVGLAIVLLATGRALDALEPLQQAIQNDTWAFRGYEYLAEAQRVLERPLDALASVERALELGEDAYALGTKGQILASLGRSDEAIDWLCRAADLEPLSDWIYVDLIPLLQQAGRLEEAVTRLQRLTEGNTSALGFGQLGILLSALQRKDEAIAALSRAAELKPGTEVVYRSLIPLLREAGRLEDAKKHLEILAVAAPSAWGYGELGETLRLLERYPDALKALDSALELDPESAFALGTKGQVLRKLKDLDAARACLEHALRVDSTLRWAKEELVLTIGDSGSPEETLPLLEQLLTDDPSWARGHAQRGATLRGLERFEEAAVSLEEAVRLEPDYTWALQELGECLRMLGRFEDALVALDRVLIADPTSSFAAASKAAVLLTARNDESALATATLATRLDPGNIFAIRVQAVALRNLSRSDEAIEVLQEGLTLRPDDVDLLGELGETLRLMDREAEAIEILDRALKQDPDNSFCLAIRGYALRTLDRYTEALRDLRRAVEIDENYAWARGALGHVLLEIGALPEAIAHAERAFRIDESLVWSRAVEGYAYALLGNMAAARDAALNAYEREPLELNWTQHLADALIALGERSRALTLYREVIEHGASATDADTIARVAWSHRWLGEHDASARTYQRALTLGARRVEYMRFDFALALLCGGRAELARREYERAVKEMAVQHPLRARGLLVAARVDFEQADRLLELPAEGSAPIRRMLDGALAHYLRGTDGDANQSPAAVLVSAS